MRERIVGDLASSPDVRWACLSGGDGLPLITAPEGVATTEAGAAVSASLLEAGANDLGEEIERVTLIGSDGILIVIRVDQNHRLLVAMERTPNHGSVRAAAIDAAARLSPLMPRI